MSSAETAKKAPVTEAPPTKSHDDIEIEEEKSPLWGTTLSVLIAFSFFYQPFVDRQKVWGYLVDLFGGNEYRMFVLGSFGLSFSMWLLSNLTMTVIYYLQLPFFEQFKIQRRPWSWLGSEDDRQEFWGLVRLAIPLVLFNKFCIALPGLALNYPTAKLLGMSTAVADVPAWYVSVLHITAFMILEDSIFYWVHRILHHKSIYAYVHKLHHRFRMPIGLAAEFAHPIEYFLSNLLPFSLGPMLLGSHLYTFWMWIILRLWETLDGHSGYSFPWSPFRLIPFSGSAAHHDFHHSRNVGNFASFFTWWDRLGGTDKAFHDHMARLRKQAVATKAE